MYSDRERLSLFLWLQFTVQFTLRQSECSPLFVNPLFNKLEKFSLSPDPRTWGADLSPDLVEADDCIHNPEKSPIDSRGKAFEFSRRGAANLGCLVVLCAASLALL